MSFVRRLGLFALAYWAGAELSYFLLHKAGNFSAFWPPAGIYLGMLLATPRARWGGVVLAAAIANLLTDVGLHGQSIARGLGFLLVNLGAPLVAAALLERLCRPALSFARLAHVVMWSLVVTFVSTPLGALGGAAIIVITRGGTFSQKWFLWWVGDLLGVLALTPLAYELFRARAWPQRKRILEAAALLFCVGAATFIVFRWPHVHALPPAVLFLFLMWAAERFNTGIVAAAATLLAVIALWLTGTGFGPYIQLDLPRRALMVQMMAAAAALFFYILAAAMAERRAAEDELRHSNLRLEEQVKARTAELTTANAQLRANEARLQAQQETIRQQFAEIETIYQTAPVGLACLDRALRFVRVNERMAEMNGVSREQTLGRTLREVLPASFVDILEPLYHRVLATGEEVSLPEINGETAAQPGVTRAWQVNAYPLRDAADAIIGVNAVVQEITARKQAEAALLAQARELAEANMELLRFNRAVVGRELRMIELKQEINALCVTAGRPPRFPLEFESDGKP